MFWISTLCKIALRSDLGILDPAYAKFPTKCSLGYSFWVLPTRYPLGCCTDFIDQYTLKDVVSRKGVPFVGPENEILHLTTFSQKRKFSINFDGTYKISAQNRL